MRNKALTILLICAAFIACNLAVVSAGVHLMRPQAHDTVSSTTSAIVTDYVNFQTLEAAIPLDSGATLQADYRNEALYAQQYNQLVKARPQAKPDGLPILLVAQTPEAHP